MTHEAVDIAALINQKVTLKENQSLEKIAQESDSYTHQPSHAWNVSEIIIIIIIIIIIVSIFFLL